MSSTLHWDAICIGAGITSLAFGAQLVKKYPGIRLALIDKHSVPGGYATVFHRPKAAATFDCSLHKLSGTGDGGNLRRIFAELGLSEELRLITPTDYFEAVLPDKTFTLCNDSKGVEQELARQFPQEAPALAEFFNEVAIHGRNGYYQFQIMDGSFKPNFAELRYAHRHLKNITVAEALALRFKSGQLKELIAATGIYVGGYPEDLGYLYFLHVVYATLFKGNAYIHGASQRLSNVLATRIASAGGMVLLNTTVNTIVRDTSDQVTGVVTSRGEFYSKKIYINAAPHYAMDALFGNDQKLQPVTNKLASLKPSRSTTTLYATSSVAPASIGLTSTETMILGASHEDAIANRNAAAATPLDEERNEHAYWTCSPMEVTNYHALDAAQGHVICLNILDTITHWPQRKSPQYKTKKKRAAQAMLERLYVAKPALRGQITFTEVSTPRTYQRFTNNTDGAGYGAMIGTDLSSHLFHHRFPVEGVHFLSAWVAGPSYEAAFGYAEMKVRQWA